MTTSNQPEKRQATSAAEQRDRSGLLMIATIVAGHTIKHIYISGFQTIILPEIKIGMGLSNTMLGGLATARQATGGATTLAAGYMGDRFSSYSGLLLTLSLAIMGISYFLVGSALTYPLMLAAMLLVGLGPSIFHPPALGALSRRFPKRRGFVISLHGTGGSLGEAAGPLIAAAAVGGVTWIALSFSGLEWRGTMQWSIIPALIAAAMMGMILRNIPMGEGGTTSLRGYFNSLGRLLGNRSLLAILGISALRALGQSSTVIFLPVFLRDDLGFSLTRVAIYLSLSQLAGIGAQPFMGALSDRLGRKAVLVPAQAAFGVLLIALRFVPTGFPLVVVIVAMGTFLYSLQALFLATASDMGGPEVQATTASLVYGTTFISATISPLLAGMIADTLGIRSAFLYGAAMLLAAAVAMSILKLPRPADQSVAAGG